MNQKTESPGFAEEKRPRLIIEWIFAFSIGGLIFLLTWNSPGALLDPWTAAAGVTIERGIVAFAGHEMAGLEQVDRSYILTGVLLAFVVGPTAFLFGWRRILLGGIPQSFPATILFIAGGAVALSVFIPAVPQVLRVNSGLSETSHERAVQTAKNDLIYGLNQIAVDARSYRILPVARGGGGGSFSLYHIPERMEGGGESKFAIASAEPGALRLRGSSALLASSVALELDTARNRFTYEGAFTP